MLTLFFCRGPGHGLRHGQDARDTARFGALLPRACSSAGVYLPPSQFEAAFVSLAHTEADIDETVAAAAEAFKAAAA